MPQPWPQLMSLISGLISVIRLSDFPWSIVEGRPKTASSQETLSTAGSAESEDKFRKINLLEPQPLCYEEDEDDAQEDVHEDETDDFCQKSKQPMAGKDGLRKNVPLTGMRPKFSFRREHKLKPQAPQK